MKSLSRTADLSSTIDEINQVNAMTFEWWLIVFFEIGFQKLQKEACRPSESSAAGERRRRRATVTTSRILKDPRLDAKVDTVLCKCHDTLGQDLRQRLCQVHGAQDGSLVSAGIAWYRRESRKDDPDKVARRRPRRVTPAWKRELRTTAPWRTARERPCSFRTQWPRSWM